MFGLNLGGGGEIQVGRVRRKRRFRMEDSYSLSKYFSDNVYLPWCKVASEIRLLSLTGRVHAGRRSECRKLRHMI